MANLQVVGGIHSTLDITSDADIIAGNISLTKHRTSDVKGGSDTSGGPVP